MFQNEWSFFYESVNFDLPVSYFRTLACGLCFLHYFFQQFLFIFLFYLAWITTQRTVIQKFILTVESQQLDSWFFFTRKWQLRHFPTSNSTILLKMSFLPEAATRSTLFLANIENELQSGSNYVFLMWLITAQPCLLLSWTKSQSWKT